MRIDEFSIRRYGPLSDTGVVRPGDFSLFFAHNEEGKTLTVEALVRMLLQRDAKPLRGIDRVTETPDGYVVVDDEKLPEVGGLADISEIGPEHWRNIFVIRNSDLSIPEESAIYSGVTDRLTGLKTRDIAAVIGRLRDIGRLTPTGRISNSEPHVKIASRLETARALAEEVDSLQGRVEDENLDRLEERLAETAEKMGRVEADLRAQEEARKRDTYHKGREALAELRQALGRLDGLKGFTDQDERTWADGRKLVEQTRGHIHELKEKAKETGTRIDDLEADLKRTHRELRALDQRRSDIEELRFDLKEYDRAAERLEASEAQARLMKVAALVLAVLTGLALAAALLTGQVLSGLLAALFGAGGFICGGLVLRHARGRGKAAAQLTRIRQVAARAGLKGETSDQVKAAIRELDDQHDGTAGAAREVEAEIKVSRDTLKKTRDDEIPKAEKAISDADETIEAIQRKSGAQAYEEYRKQLADKRRLEDIVRTDAAVLASRLGKRSEGPAENVGFWEHALEPLAEYAESAPGVTYSEGEVKALEDTHEQLTDERGALQRSLGSLRGELNDVARRANDVLRPEDDYLHCETSGDLAAIRVRLQDFLQEHGGRADLARAAVAIFEDIGRAEQEKVAELFGPDSAVSGHFTDITDSLYEAVLYECEDEERRVLVRTAGGETLDAECLSGGAYDQLYLSIRLALGEALLGGKPGFFIMDDPFVKADPVRLDRQLNILKRIAERGWQILYFTAKGEVRDALAGDVEAGRVRGLSLQGVRRQDRLEA